MLENKDTNNSPNASIDKETDENSEFVELDPIGRYGRVKILSNIMYIIF